MNGVKAFRIDLVKRHRYTSTKTGDRPDSNRGRWTRWEVIVGGVMPVRIKHRDKNSTSTQPPEMSLVATESALLSKVFYMARTTVF
jgi:hypothetical protein